MTQTSKSASSTVASPEAGLNEAMPTEVIDKGSAGKLSEKPVQTRSSGEDRPRLGRVLAVVNQKGGVGKTTSAINLGASLGALEYKVLLVDSDPQGNASRGLGSSADGALFYDVLTGDAGVKEAIRPSGFPFLDLLPANRDLVGAEVEFVGVKGWEHTTARALAPIRRDYDFVLIDCPPSLGHLTVMALAAASGVLVPIQCEYFALEGVSELASTLTRIQSALNPGLNILGVLLTMYDDRTNLARDVVREIRRHFPEQVFKTIVPRNIRLAEAPSHGISVLEYDIKSRGAQAYLALAQEVIARCVP